MRNTLMDMTYTANERGHYSSNSIPDLWDSQPTEWK